MFSIGKLSKNCGVKIPTIRYYEQMQLINKPERTEGNQRRYNTEHLQRLRFIKHARDLGFPIQDIRSLIELDGHHGKPCKKATQISTQQLQAVQNRIERLKRLESELIRISSGCDESQDECYVLTALSDHGFCDSEH